LSRFPQPLNHSTPQLLNDALRVRLRFGKTDNFATFFPLAAFLEQLDPLETLQNIAFRDNRTGSSETSVL
jgi:hypothetical protein